MAESFGLPPLIRGELREIPVAAIRPSPRNPRTDAEDDLDGLVASLGLGLVQAPIVAPMDQEQYELVDGERRWRAARAVGSETIPCIVCAPLAPTTLLVTQIVANLHRRDLNPLDESAALKIAWLAANASAMGLTAEADETLRASPRLRDALAPLTALLEQAGWSWRDPPVTQAAFLEQAGLALSGAALRKKIQLLAASPEIQEGARRHRLTAAAIRSLMTLDPDDQAVVLRAIDAEPALARSVRAIVQGVKTKGRTLAEAIAIAAGRDLSDIADLTALASDAGEDQDDSPAPRPAAMSPAPADADAPPALDDTALMTTVMPVIELAETIQQRMRAVQALVGSAGMRIPEPWRSYLAQAVVLIAEAIAPFQEESHVV